MARYVAFLRGVNPMNCKMPDLKRNASSTHTHALAALRQINDAIGQQKRGPKLLSRRVAAVLLPFALGEFRERPRVAGTRAMSNTASSPMGHTHAV